MLLTPELKKIIINTTVIVITIGIIVYIVLYFVNVFDGDDLNGNPFHNVYWFYSNSCSHCNNMKAAWNSVKNNKSRQYNFIEVDVSDNKNKGLVNKYAAVSVPHIVKTFGKNHDNYKVYNGDRSVGNILAWIN